MHYIGGTDLTGAALVAATKRCLAVLDRHKITPSCIVMQGVSGMAVGMVLAAKLGCNYAVVRKPGEDSHSYERLTGQIPTSGQVVLVDDFTATGDTIVRMLKVLRESDHWNTHRDVTVLLYQQESGPSMALQTLNHHLTDEQCGEHGYTLDQRNTRAYTHEVLRRVTFLCCADGNGCYEDGNA